MMSNVKVFDVVYYKVDDDGNPLLREDGHYRLWREKEECEVEPNVMYIPGEDELEEHWDMDQAPSEDRPADPEHPCYRHPYREDQAPSPRDEMISRMEQE